MRLRLRSHLTAANVLATIALIVSLALGGPAIARPIAGAATSAASTIDRALGIATRADRRSKRAIALARKRAKGGRGVRGEKGEPGDPGPLGGFAGGDLLGSYPSPLLALGSVGPAQFLSGAVGSGAIAPEAITAGHLETEALGGDQIVEHSLVGLDMSSFDANSSRGLETLVGWDEFSHLIGNEILLTHRCIGTIPDVGFQLIFENDSPSQRTVYASALTTGMAPDLNRFVIAPDGKATVNLPPSKDVDLARRVTLLVPAPEYEIRVLSISTRSGELGNDCWIDTFRTRISDGFVR
jgi:hypothetical protein